MSKSVLITGANGDIGHVAVQAAVKQGKLYLLLSAMKPIRVNS